MKFHSSDILYPHNLKQLRRYIGVCSYYRRFISNFAAKAYPLYQLLKNDVSWSWDYDQQTAFDILKHALISDHVLALPDFHRPFKLTTDASKKGLGAVLEQLDLKTDPPLYKPVAYASRSVAKAELNYSATDLEAKAVVWSVKMFRPYLYMNQIEIWTDHSALASIFHLKSPPNSRLGKFAMELSGYNFTIHYKPGPQNQVADALSRAPCDQSLQYATISELPPGQPEPGRVSRAELCFLADLCYVGQVPDPHQQRYKDFRPSAEAELSDAQLSLQWKAELEADIYYGPLLRYLRDDLIPDDPQQVAIYDCQRQNYYVQDDLLRCYVRDFRGRLRIASKPVLVVPAPFRKTILEEAHISTIGGAHYALKSTYDRIRVRYMWKTMYRDIDSFIKACQTCQRFNKGPITRAGLRKRLPYVSYAFEMVAIDIVGPLPTTSGQNVYLLVVIDYLTRYCEVFALPNSSASTVARVLVRDVILRHGEIRCILTDNGSNFRSKLFMEICKLFGIKQLRTTAYHPQCNGMVERLNGTLCKLLAKKCWDHQGATTEWDEYLPYVRWAYNTSPQRRVDNSPHFLLYCEDPELPTSIANFFKPSLVHWPERQRLDEIRHCLTMARQDALEIWEAGQRYDIKRHDLKARSHNYKVGDLVWLNTRRIVCRDDPPHGRKMKSLCSGPYKVLEVRENNVLVILRPDFPRYKRYVTNVERIKATPNG